jgi:hypothetical protein
VKNKRFDWDKYFDKASYKEVRSNSPELSSRRDPTVYSPGREWIYLSSQDLDARTNDVEELKSILRFLHESFVIAKKFNDQTKMARIRIDHLEVCGLLHLLDEAPDDYADPDSLLDRVSV